MALRILSIEDNLPNQRLAHELLESVGMTVDDATNGAHGLHLAEEYAYDGVLLDLGLDDMSGIEILARLRSQGRKMPIVIASARHDCHVKDTCMRLGATAYLEKPFGVLPFITCVNQAFRVTVA